MTRFISSIVLLSIFLYLGNSRLGSLPPLLNFLDPAHGVWAISNTEDQSDLMLKPIEGLSDKIQIIYDNRQVPHIYAQTIEDVLLGLGYAVARDRLFQLELQTRATAGTLTEILGERVLPLDRQARQLGLAWAAEKNHSELAPTSKSYRYQAAYAKGVNAWIGEMTASKLPLEYHLLGQKPMEWLPQYSAYLNKNMGRTLSMKNTERRKFLAARLVGEDAANALFPVNSWIQEPIQPNGQKKPRFDPIPLAEPGRPCAGPRDSLSDLGLFTLPEELDQNHFLETTLGSNNWAISASRSSNGNPIISGDPHLNLTLPSIWYEAHLNVPGELDVYGVTIPGSPGIVIGFNRNVAWTFTNTGSDVMDFYKEQVDDPQDPKAYILDDQWKTLKKRVEAYVDTKGSVIQTDTILHTHRGPVAEENNVYTSMRWTVLEESGELDAFLAIAKATSVDDWMSGMESWMAPTQNGLVIDRLGNIAIRSTGRYPIRPFDTSGDQIYDGSVSENDWKGWFDISDYPGSINPEQGYLTSSNQQPVDPILYESYIGSDWPPPWRAMRINQLLRSDPTYTLEDLIEFQTDPGSARADIFVAAFLNAANTFGYDSSASTQEAISLLSEWDRLYTKSNERAILFETAMNKLAENTWDELEDEEGRAVVRPGSTVLAALLQTPENKWWDDRSTTDKQENRDDILIKSLGQAIETIKNQYGTKSEGGWRWDKVQTANIYHLMNIPGLSALGVPVQGGPETLSPNSGSGRHGASWRMVVELGDSIIAKGVYPGGQSGNPLSPAYKNRLDDWSSGSLQDLYFPKHIEEMLKSSVKIVELIPVGDP
tara:strand:- start:1967 stop:4441 length:2475 start_codon:yes stop_codon:yes gene_type:complete